MWNTNTADRIRLISHYASPPTCFFFLRSIFHGNILNPLLFRVWLSLTLPDKVKTIRIEASSFRKSKLTSETWRVSGNDRHIMYLASFFSHKHASLIFFPYTIFHSAKKGALRGCAFEMQWWQWEVLRMRCQSWPFWWWMASSRGSVQELGSLDSLQSWAALLVGSVVPAPHCFPQTSFLLCRGIRKASDDHSMTAVSDSLLV